MGPITQPATLRQIKNANSETTTVVELDMDPYQLTASSVVDFVLREYPPTKVGKGPPTSTFPGGGDPMKLPTSNGLMKKIFKRSVTSTHGTNTLRIV